MTDKSLFINSLELQKQKIEGLKNLSRHNINFEIWWEETRKSLENAFGIKSEMVKCFKNIRFRKNRVEAREAYLHGLEQAFNLLQECIDILDDDVTQMTIGSKTKVKCTTINDEVILNIKMPLSEIEGCLEKVEKTKRSPQEHILKAGCLTFMRQILEILDSFLLG